MIRIESIRIEEFRGIRHLSLDLAEKNYAICGRNGTGKSGVVDAIEFALTGSASRLTGRGTGGISVKAHGPHVDIRDQPEKARVVLQMFIPGLGKTATVERRLNKPQVVTVTPDEAEIRAVVDEIAGHPEFALSRREILKYVMVEPGERSKEVQALLKLEDINRVRASLQMIANTCKNEVQQCETEVGTARSNLLRALGVEEVKSEVILNAANEKRRLLGLAELTELGRDTSLKVGVAERAASDKKPSVNKSLALSELLSLIEVLDSPEPGDIGKARTKILSVCDELLKNTSLRINLKRQVFIQTGLDLISDELCPLCDTPWTIEELRALLRRKLAEATEAARLQATQGSAAAVLNRDLLELVNLLDNTAGHAGKLDPAFDASALLAWASALRALASGLTSLDHLEETRQLMEDGYRRVPSKARPALDALLQRFHELPEPSKEHEAREYLIVGQERLEVYRQAKRRLEMKRGHEARAAVALRVYNETSTRILTGIYAKVASDFSRFYRFINREDEDSFKGKLIPSLGKLGFEVDFYGRGFFPPGAYHSEGHQDAMGLCLYLALMKHTLADRFTFAVLDDVLMSIDKGHRKEVCRLLKTEFPDTQFIVTTHDSVWLKHLQTEQVVTSKSVAHFRKWTVDDGPSLWDEKEIWEEIRLQLENDEVPAAAGALRRFLEFITDDLAGRLRLNLEYRSEGDYELGDLLPAVITGWNDLLGKAKVAAESWKDHAELERLKKLHEDFKCKVTRSQVEQWAINKSVHYNAWADLQKEDFLPVVSAFRDLVESFKCQACGGFLYVTPTRGSREGIRCDCSKTMLNLKKA